MLCGATRAGPLGLLAVLSREQPLGLCFALTPVSHYCSPSQPPVCERSRERRGAGALVQAVALLKAVPLLFFRAFHLMACLRPIVVSSLEAINMAFLGPPEVINHVMFTFWLLGIALGCAKQIKKPKSPACDYLIGESRAAYGLS